MILEPLPELALQTVVVATTIRKPLPVLQRYLQSLDWQVLPPHVRLVPIFVSDFEAPNDPALAYLHEWCAARGGTVLAGGITPSGDFSDAGGPTHNWTPSAMARCGRNKDRLLDRARQLGATAIWLCDSDLVCDRYTLQSLWSLNAPIACAVYWTHWQKATSSEHPQLAGPQVWLRHPYQLDGRGMDVSEFRERLTRRQVTQVWGQGACTLIRQDALHKGVSFAYLPDVPQEGMMAGEDRHFCIRAERLHIPMMADPWPDVYHIYHLPDDLATVPEWLGEEHTGNPTLGNLVSLRLEALEPLPRAPGQWVHPAPEFVRGRLGQIPLVPEIEEAVYAMARGDEAIVPMHCSAHHPIPYLRSKRRLIWVNLLDHKPFRFPPVIDAELYRGTLGGGVVDTATMDPAMLAGMVEVANG